MAFPCWASCFSLSLSLSLSFPPLSLSFFLSLPLCFLLSLSLNSFNNLRGRISTNMEMMVSEIQGSLPPQPLLLCAGVPLPLLTAKCTIIHLTGFCCHLALPCSERGFHAHTHTNTQTHKHTHRNKGFERHFVSCSTWISDSSRPSHRPPPLLSLGRCQCFESFLRSFSLKANALSRPLVHKMHSFTYRKAILSEQAPPTICLI